MISKKVTLTINDYKVKLSSPICLYRADAIYLIFSIYEYGIEVNGGVREKKLMPIYPLNAVLLLESPDNQDFIESVRVNGNEIIFHIDSKYTNFVGTSRMQLILTDENCCQITIPEFPFEVRNNIYDGFFTNQDLILVDENNNPIITEQDAEIKVGESIGNVNHEIKELPLDDDLTGEEDILLQDTDGITKRTKVSNFPTRNEFNELEEIVNPFNVTLSASQTIVELGDKKNIELVWDYNKEIVSQTINDSTLDIEERTKVYEQVSKTTTFTLKATSTLNKELSKSITINFFNGIYYGTSSSTSINFELIFGLTKTLSNSKSRTINVNAIEDQYIYYALPSRLGEVEFKVNGFSGGFSLVKTFNLANSYGYEEQYYVYRSTYTNLGQTTVIIS